MATPVKQRVRDSAFKADDLVEGINREIAPTLRETRQRLNEFILNPPLAFELATGLSSVSGVAFTTITGLSASVTLEAPRTIYVIAGGSFAGDTSGDFGRIGISFNGATPTHVGAFTVTAAAANHAAFVAGSADLEAGDHTVEVQWLRIGAGTLTTGPLASPAKNFALIIF